MFPYGSRTFERGLGFESECVITRFVHKADAVGNPRLSRRIAQKHRRKNTVDKENEDRIRGVYQSEEVINNA